MIEQRIYEDLSEVIASQLIHELQASVEQPNRPPFEKITKNSEQILKNIDQVEMQKLVSQLLPVEWARIKFENIIDQYFASMDNGIYRPTLLIAMDDIKERLISKVGLSFYVDLIRAQPPCSEEEKAAWQSNYLEEAPACFPSETILKESEPKTIELLYQITARMPDEASLDYFFGSFGFKTSENNIATNLQTFLTNFWKARFLIRISPVLLLALLFLLGLFQSSDRNILQLWALPVLLGGLASLLVSALLSPLTNLVISSRIMPTLPAYISPVLVEAFARIGRAAVANIRPLIAIQSVLITLLGGLMYLANYVRRKRLKFRRPSSKKYTLQ